MAKICSNFVAAGAIVIFNFALDSVIRKVKETTEECSLFKKCLQKQKLQKSLYVVAVVVTFWALFFSDVSFQPSSESCNKQSSLCGIKNQKTDHHFNLYVNVSHAYYFYVYLEYALQLSCCVSL